MSIREVLLPELEFELATTRRCLERLPETELAFRPHPKSVTAGQLVQHIAQLPLWGSTVFDGDELDLEPGGKPAWLPKPVESVAAVLKDFDTQAQQLKQSLSQADDAAMMSTWTLLKNGATILSMPRIAVYRSFVLKHMVHHRGQLSVYLRMLGVPVPSIYGPSADEGSM
ncbi:MAG: DinB family protein [Bryobacterales bacterium]|nr:DinB family protein [Bryobacterales bacterium]